MRVAPRVHFDGRMNRLSVTATILVASSGSVLDACSRSEAASAPTPPTQVAGPASWSTIAFTKATACAATWSDAIPARIAFDEGKTSRLGVPLGGRVTEVAVERGQHVTAGAPLFAVASADLAVLRSHRDKARLELATAHTNHDRIQPLVEAGALPAKERVVADQEVTEARVALDTSEQALRSLRVDAKGEGQFVVTAPRAGTVIDLHVSVGQQVSADLGPILTIGDVSDVWVYADVVDDSTRDLTVGTLARVKLDNQATVDGTIDQISAIVDPDRHAVPVRVRLDNATGVLRPGAYAEIQFYGNAAHSTCVPSTAVLSDGASHYVFVRASGAITRREVVAARPNAGSTVIRAGLAVGDEIVAANGALLDNQVPTID